MKTKKNRSFRKNLQFYRIHFHFQQPYQLILDGNFIKTMDENSVDIEKQFQKITKQTMWKHTTLCVLRELSNLSHLFPQAYKRALKLSKIDCRHVEGVNPSDCFLDLLSQPPVFQGRNNFYWVCTQDDDLRSKLLQINYVPVCFLYQKNLLELCEPSYAVRQSIQQLSSSKYKPSERELEVLRPIQKELKLEQAKRRMEKERKIAQELTIKIRKPAKGPNPLSIKRKQIRKKKQNKRRHKIKFKQTRRVLKL